MTADEIYAESLAIQLEPMWQRMLKTSARFGVSLVAGTGMVLKAPKIAASFVVARGVKPVKNTYAKILWGALLSVAALFLLLNAAEVAVLATALAVADALDQWHDYIEAAA